MRTLVVVHGHVTGEAPAELSDGRAVSALGPELLLVGTVTTLHASVLDWPGLVSEDVTDAVRPAPAVRLPLKLLAVVCLHDLHVEWSHCRERLEEGGRRLAVERGVDLGMSPAGDCVDRGVLEHSPAPEGYVLGVDLQEVTGDANLRQVGPRLRGPTFPGPVPGRTAVSSEDTANGTLGQDDALASEQECELGPAPLRVLAPDRQDTTPGFPGSSTRDLSWTAPPALQGGQVPGVVPSLPAPEGTQGYREATTDQSSVAALAVRIHPG